MSEKYLPLTEEEFKELEVVLNEIGAYLPENRMNYVWNTYRKVNNIHNEPQPCSCQSSAGLWVKAVNSLHAFVKEKNV
jgi:hypothetical protein